MTAKGEDLSQWVSKTDCFCLNEAPGFDHTHLFAGDHTLYLKSDADEQLIIHLAYNQTVKLSSITLGLPADRSCPATVKVFVNKVSLGFAEATDEAPTMVLNLEPPEAPTKIDIPLPPTKFSRVDSITLFVEDNHGEEFSSLFSLHVFGTPVMGTNVANIGKEPDK